MEFFASPDLWIAFLTLFVLELVLGVDNVVFISILASKLPTEQRKRARNVGLLLAMLMRIGLLFVASWVIGLTVPLFGWGTGAFQFSGRDLILIVGGAFLVYKAVIEIHARLEGNEHSSATGRAATFGAIIAQIVVLDVVFSLDSVITAVGMVDELYIMIAAVVLAIGIMLFTAGIISSFVEKHPTVKMLALAFLVLIGSTLIADGFDVHVSKGLIYGPIAFAILVEVLNLLYRARQSKLSQVAPDPVHLRSPHTASPDAPQAPDVNRV
ncbi:MAG: TerC family protein [Microbacteriaceae bacterium]|nr:TerC family protein [Microbacteriaceae bacterium]